ncbi:16S rRNA (guanine(527)-N(7))-methyltransferase RsmG [Eubacteriales bacterium OttesenSCG-928-N14]|nr:16S rRNA (guanine(527)-N(7))-methyltransferase RsmG [Eubacteriales bacterium OttesenSCG-928-N14]
MPFESLLRKGLAGMQLQLEEHAISQLLRYHALLMQSNQTLNLTSIDDDADAVSRHYLDSLSPLQYEGLLPHGATVIDVGSGAGFPGLPLAIARPDLQVLLLDSLQKRIHFLQNVTLSLELDYVATLHARAEDAGRNSAYRDKYSIAVSRAVGALPTLAEYCLPFVQPGGSFLAYKGLGIADELQQAEHAISLLGGGKVTVLNANVPGLEHTLAVIEKIAPTPQQYPRKAGTPSKQPL